MKEYFFLKGKEQNGPFTIEQLFDKGLTKETLVWTEGMENWQKLKDIPELALILKTKSGPPPAPISYDEKISKSEEAGQLKIITEKIPNSTIEVLKPSQTTLKWLIFWCGFHLLALLMSYSQIKIFNNTGSPKSNELWPLVKFNPTWPKQKLVT